MVGDGQQEMLGRDVLVLQLAHLLLGVAQDLDELGGAAGRLGTGSALKLRQRVERLAVGLAHGDRVDPQLAQHRDHGPAVLTEQHGGAVRRQRLRLSVLVGDGDDGVLVLVLGVDVDWEGALVVMECDELFAVAEGAEADEVDWLAPPLASAYATAPPSRSSATTARKAHGPAPRERWGG